MPLLQSFGMELNTSSQKTLSVKSIWKTDLPAGCRTKHNGVRQ